MYRPHAIIAMLVSGLLYALPAPAQTSLYVDGANGNDQGGANDCTDANFPCQTISHAVDISFGGDTIEISDGTYTEALDIPRSLALQGESRTGTIIQGHAQVGLADIRVITIDGEFEVTISDLTIRHGDAEGSGLISWGGGLLIRDATVTVHNVDFNENRADGAGGAIYNLSGDATLTNVSFSSNSSDVAGGGIYTDLGDVTLVNASFITNHADLLGGGFVNSRGTATMTNVSFGDNSASSDEVNHGGGGLVSAGLDAVLALTDVTFIRNNAGRGGGMRIDGGEATLRNVRFQDNSAESHGGGIYIQESAPTLSNVLFYGNAADNNGGGMFTWTDASPWLINTTFSGNSAGNVGGGLRIGGGSTVLLFNTIIWGNTASNDSNEIHVNNNSFAGLNYGLYGDGAGDTGGGGSFDVDTNSLTDDPLFVDPDNGNLRLMEGSPAIDAGSALTNPGFFPTDDNGDPIDFDGNPRYYPGEEDIDIGAYEWLPPDWIFSDGFE